MLKKYEFVIFLLLFSFGLNYCLQVIFERAKVTYVNEKYAQGNFTVRRLGRNTPYYFNIEGFTKHTWANNITVNIIFNEFLHNEYRRSFIEFHFKLCDFLKNEPYIGGMLAAGGARCPLPPGEYHLMNMTANTDNFPNVFPFEKGRIEGEAVVGVTGETIFRAHMDCIFKNTPKKTAKGKVGFLLV